MRTESEFSATRGYRFKPFNFTVKESVHVPVCVCEFEAVIQNCDSSQV